MTRALNILFYLTSMGTPLDVSELAEATLLPRPTVYRYLEALSSEGLIVRQGSQVAVTPKLSLMITGSSAVPIRDIALPFLHSVVEETGETASIHTRSGSLRVCVLETEGTHGIRWSRGIGFTAPIYSGAVGHVFMGHIEEREARKILDEAEIVATSSASITQKSELYERAKTARCDGYSLSCNETVEGASALAAPISMGSSEIFGVLGLYAPSSRFDALRKHVILIRETAHEIAQRWQQVTGISTLTPKEIGHGN